MHIQYDFDLHNITHSNMNGEADHSHFVSMNIYMHLAFKTVSQHFVAPYDRSNHKHIDQTHIDIPHCGVAGHHVTTMATLTHRKPYNHGNIQRSWIIKV